MVKIKKTKKGDKYIVAEVPEWGIHVSVHHSGHVHIKDKKGLHLDIEDKRKLFFTTLFPSLEKLLKEGALIIHACEKYNNCSCLDLTMNLKLIEDKEFGKVCLGLQKYFLGGPCPSFHSILCIWSGFCRKGLDPSAYAERFNSPYSRVYPPKWCIGGTCKDCPVKNQCVGNQLNIFDAYKGKMPAINESTEITTWALYEYCPRLGKFALQFPQKSPHVAVRDNFINSQTELPTTQSIQRIFLDMLELDSSAPTNDAHFVRAAFFSKASGVRTRFKENDKLIELDESEIDTIFKKLDRWIKNFKKGKLEFPKTSDSLKCEYCFLKERCE